MFALHVSSRMENLLHHLGEVLAVDPQPDIFAPELFLIQSQGMERLVVQNLTDRFGCFCNFRFFLPLDFLTYIAEQLGMGLVSTGFNRQELVWRLYELLGDLAGPEFYQVQSYLQDDKAVGGSSDKQARKRFQLARRLANCFDQYQLMRVDLLDGWEQGHLLTENQSEAWQRVLWLRLREMVARSVGPDGQTTAVVHRGLLFQRIIERLRRGIIGSDILPIRISIFGLHTMPPLFLDYLNSLAEHMDVHLFLLSPCRKYWGDAVPAALRLRRQLRSQQTGSRAVVAGDMPEHEHHPLLEALGKQGRDFQNLLLDRAEFSVEVVSYQSPLDPLEDDTDFPGERYTDAESDPYLTAPLLHRIQADLLDDRLPISDRESGSAGYGLAGASSAGALENESLADDGSVRIVSCHSKLRELMVLKEHLLQLLRDDDLLELRDIVVMAPDVQEYASLIPAVFHDIQHSIADRSIRRRNPVVKTFLRFLELVGGRYGWSELVDVLRQEPVAAHYALSAGDLERIEKWVVEAGIRWGLSSEQREESGLSDFDEASWRFGLDRLLMGYAIDSDDFVAGILPYSDIEGSADRCLGALCAFVELVENFRQHCTQRLSLLQWSELLLSSVEQLFGDEDDAALLELRGVLSELGELFAGKENHLLEPLPFGVVREWLQLTTRESRSSSGFLRGQLTFCSMLPMRSIPFKVVCLLGLNDGVFPKPDRHDTFDLLGVESRPGDRSPRADDRYQFLEALLSARKVFYLSYIGQSMSNNDVIPPSVVVSEFVELLTAGYRISHPVVAHPLHPFSSRYFQRPEIPGLFSSSRYYCDVAERLVQGPSHPELWFQGELKADQAELQHIAWGDVLQFYKNPQKFFLNRRLSVRLDYGSDVPEDSELFSSSGLIGYQAVDAMVRSGLHEFVTRGKSVVPERELVRLQAAGLWPLGTPGRLLHSERSKEVLKMLQQIESLKLGQPVADQSFDLQLSRTADDDSFRLSGVVGGLYEHGALYLRSGKLRGQDLLQGWLLTLINDHLRPGSPAYLVAMDGCFCLQPDDEAPSLLRMLEVFGEGWTRYSHLLVEPGLVYAKQAVSRAAKISPLDKAKQRFETDLEKDYYPELTLLCSPAETAIDWAVFEHYCEELFCPIWNGAKMQAVTL